MVSNNDHYSPNFPKHRTSSKSHKHRLPIRPSNHLHLSSFDDVHLSADLTLTARAERDKSQFKMLTDKRLFHGGCLMWPLLRQPSNILAIYWDYWGFKMFLQASSKAHTVNHKKSGVLLTFLQTESPGRYTTDFSLLSMSNIICLSHPWKEQESETLK